jgi:hypothetical protein
VSQATATFNYLLFIILMDVRPYVGDFFSYLVLSIEVTNNIRIKDIHENFIKHTDNIIIIIILGMMLCNLFCGMHKI